MLKRRNLASAAESGFTLVEIAISVAILGLALVTLIVMQTRFLDIHTREKNYTRATLYAGYLLTLIEVSPDTPPTGTSSVDLFEALEDAGYFDDSAGKLGGKNPEESLQGWTYEKSVTRVDIPPFEDILRRIDLTIRWGERERDRYTVVYFAKNDAKAKALQSATSAAQSSSGQGSAGQSSTKQGGASSPSAAAGGEENL